MANTIFKQKAVEYLILSGVIVPEWFKKEIRSQVCWEMDEDEYRLVWKCYLKRKLDWEP